MINNNDKPGERIDFKKVAAAALDNIESLVPTWLPEGKRGAG